MKSRGQIAIITLFSLAVFVVISGSIVTQIVFEQKKAILEEKSRQAYYAAESGIESALQEIIAGNETVTDSIEIGNAGVNITTESTGEDNIVVFPQPLYSGESFYLNLDGYSASSVRICWDKPDTGIVVTYFYNNASNFLRTNTYALNSQGSNNISNGFVSQNNVNGCSLSGSIYYYDLTLPIGTPAYLLVWVAYQDNVQIAFEALEGSSFPPQYTVVTSTAKVSENNDSVTRELKYLISKIEGTTLSYPPIWLTVPVFAGSGVNYAAE